MSKSVQAKSGSIRIRGFQESDSIATANIFYQSIRVGAAQCYTESEREAWAPRVPEQSQWSERLSSQFTLVAVNNHDVLGFISMISSGCVDLFFVRPDVMGKGVSESLYQELIEVAEKAGIMELSVDASLLARSFFRRRGWCEVGHQNTVRNGQQLTGFHMQKRLVQT